MEWFVTNIDSVDYTHGNNILTNISGYDGKSLVPQIIIDGYIVPRTEIFEEYKNHTQTELAEALYQKYGSGFIHRIKGIFTILVFNGARFSIFSDRHGIKKYFIFRQGQIIFISNSLQMISKKFSLETDRENAAVFLLFSHFIDGATLFSNVNSNKPAQVTEFINNKLHYDFYWQPSSLLNDRVIEKLSYVEYAKKWLDIIKGYCDYLKPGMISYTLTGGNDSRMVLAALLHCNYPLHGFTYGDPSSFDGVISASIREKLKLDHENYHVDNPSFQWFEQQAGYLALAGNSLINIHRAHRNDASDKEKLNFPKSEMLCTGLVGGEYIKDPRNNEMVIPALLQEVIRTENNTGIVKGLIIKSLTARGANIQHIDIDTVVERIDSFASKGKGYKNLERKFIFTYYYYACTHHSQDANLYGLNFKYVVNPFMDIDFLEMLSTYQGWYLNHNSNLISRVFQSELIVGITHQLAPSLSNIPYAKKGRYTANDLLRGKLRYLIGRAISIIKTRGSSHPQNFPMGLWLYEFCRAWLKNSPPAIKYFIDQNQLLKELELTKERTTEEAWHCITNVVNLSILYESYCKTESRNS
jgi:hypothetical protein